MNYNQSQRAAAAVVQLGTRVDRAAANMTNALALFDIEGGNCQINLIVGEVSGTKIQNTGTNNQLNADVDTGGDEVLCAVLDWDDDEIGSLYTISGIPTDAMQTGQSGACEGQTYPIVVAPGAIDITIGATSSGSVKWSLWYIPLEIGAYIEAT